MLFFYPVLPKEPSEGRPTNVIHPLQNLFKRPASPSNLAFGFFMSPSPRVIYLTLSLLLLILLLSVLGFGPSAETLSRFFRTVIEGLNNFDYVPAP
jgi:hypothetical protein